MDHVQNSQYVFHILLFTHRNKSTIPFLIFWLQSWYLDQCVRLDSSSSFELCERARSKPLGNRWIDSCIFKDSCEYWTRAIKRVLRSLFYTLFMFSYMWIVKLEIFVNVAFIPLEFLGQSDWTLELPIPRPQHSILSSSTHSSPLLPFEKNNTSECHWNSPTTFTFMCICHRH